MRTGAENGGNPHSEDFSCILNKAEGERDVDLAAGAAAGAAPCKTICGH